jgi:hypothetical protein
LAGSFSFVLAQKEKNVISSSGQTNLPAPAMLLNRKWQMVLHVLVVRRASNLLCGKRGQTLEDSSTNAVAQWVSSAITFNGRMSLLEEEPVRQA